MKASPARLGFLNPIALAIMAMACATPASAAGSVPLGPQFAVASNSQSSPSVARSANGTTVVVWVDRPTNSVLGRRFAADGSPLDDGFTVDVPPENFFQAGADVAVDAAGDFVVTWFGRNGGFYNGYSGNSIDRILARRFTADGAPAGSQFVVGAGTASTMRYGLPAVAMDDAGDFVIGWERGNTHRELSIPGGIGYSGTDISLGNRQVAVQRFSRDGAAQGSNIVAATRADVSIQSTLIGIPVAGPALGGTFASGIGNSVDVAMDADGDFVVAWGGSVTVFGYFIANIALPYPAAVLNTSSIYARRYGANGRAALLPVLVSSSPTVLTTAGGIDAVRSGPSLAVNAAGDFAVAWSQGTYTSNSKSTVRARRFSAAGLPVPGVTSLAVSVAEVGPVAAALDATGVLTLGWKTAPGEVQSIRYAVSGNALGPVVQVSSGGADRLVLGKPALANDRSGATAFTWTDFGRADAVQTVFARIYTAP